MTITQYLDTICEKLNIGTLPDRLLTTYWGAIAKAHGVDVSALPDRMLTTYLGAILKTKGVESVPDNLVTTHLELLAQCYGATNLPDRLISTYLEAIINGLSGGNLWNPAVNPIEIGSISSSTGGESASTTRLRNIGYIKVQPNTTYKFSSNLPRLFIIEFSAEGEKPVGSSGWKNVPFEYTTTASTQFIRMTLAHETNSAITVDDFEWLKIEVVK